MWCLRSPTRDRTRVPYVARRILNHWTTREAPLPTLLTSIAQLPPKHRRVKACFIYLLLFTIYLLFFFNQEELPIT